MVTVATIDEQEELKKREDEIISKVWLALRGLGMGAPIDIEYAQALAKEFREVFIDNRN